MASYDKENQFWFDVKNYIKLIKKGILISFVFQLIIVGIVFSQIDFKGQAGESISNKVLIKYLFSYCYPDEPKSKKDLLEIDASLEPYARADWRFDNIDLLNGEWYRYLADVASDGQYEKLIKAIKISCICYVFTLLYVGYFWYSSKKSKEDKFIRGSSLITSKNFNKRLNNLADKNGGLHVGDTIIPSELETKHVLILGASGSGKGVLLNQLIAQINKSKNLLQVSNVKRMPKLIFYDVKGEFLSKHYQAGDIIMSPFDKRFCGWSFFNEFSTLPELDVLAKSLFVTDDAKNAIFYNGASEIFKGGILYLARNGKTTNSELWEFFAQSADKIEAAIKTLPADEQEALKFLSKDGAEMTASFLATLQDRIQFFKYLKGLDGDFSFKKWAQTEGIKENIFLLNIEEYSSIFKPLMTMALDLLCRTVLSLADDSERRIFFILDELGTLDKMDSLLQLETVGRSKGASIICANQDLGRIEQKYGKANLKTFYNNFNTNFFFRIGEPQTAKYIADAIGRKQVMRKTENRSINTRNSANKSENEQERTEYLIMPEEFQNLPDLTACCKIAGVGVSMVEIPHLFLKVKHEPFVKREFESIYQKKAIELQQDEIEPTENDKADEVKVKFMKM